MPFPKYYLNKKQIKGIANIVLHEQGTIAGWYAEASQIANRTDIKGDEYATAENAVKTVTSGWYAHGKSRYNQGTTNKTVIRIVENVFNKGLRTLPRYIDEHDCMSDITTVTLNGKNVKKTKKKWVKDQTIIKNRMGATYRFYAFPGGYKTGVDPFGYTNPRCRTKWGDSCFTVSMAEKLATVSSKYTDSLPKLPERGYYQHGDGKKALRNRKNDIKNIQKILIWAHCYNGPIDGIYLDGTRDAVKLFQSKCKLPVNGKFGRLCLAEARVVSF